MSGFESRNVSSRSNDRFLEEEGASQSDLEALRAYNDYDVALYDYALNLRERRRSQV